MSLLFHIRVHPVVFLFKQALGRWRTLYSLCFGICGVVKACK